MAKHIEQILEQLKALAQDSPEHYEKYTDMHHLAALQYQVGDWFYVNTCNIKTNQPMKKGNDKWDSPYQIKEVYPTACQLKLSAG